MSGRQYSLEEMAAILRPIADEYRVTGISLFGSRARGDFNDDSDYDLLIDVADDFSFGDYGAFIEEASKALGSQVDVVTRRSLSDCSLDRRILEDEVCVLPQEGDRPVRPR